MTPSPTPVSAIILTYNEEKNIEACLASLSGWVGEIIIVDSHSTDQTLSIAQRLTTKIYQRRFENYADQRNWAQELPLSHEWVLHIDADERVTPELRRAIEGFFGSGEAERYHGAMFTRRTVFMGRWIRHGGHYPVYHTRLFRRSQGRCEDRLYDQHFLVEAPVLRLKGDLIDVLTSDLDTWMFRHIRWAGKEAAQSRAPVAAAAQVAAHLFGTPIERRRWLRSRFFGRAPLFARAFLYFAYRYFVRFGFLDGVEGLVFHFLQGCWFRFYIDAKIWEMRQTRVEAVA